MMKFSRPRRPGYLDNYKRWGRKYAEQRQQGNTEFKWRARVKDQLKTDLARLTASHCSFCDSYPLGQETIEHFRPRSQFPKLAYVWHNLFLCCEACQRAKDDRFNRQLLKPDRLDYDFERYFIANFKTGEIQVNPVASVDDQERARIMIAMYGLNDFDRPAKRRTYRERIMSVEDEFKDFMALSLVIGGGNIPGFPKHPEGTLTLNIDLLARPSIQGKGQSLPFVEQIFDEVIVEGLDYFQLDKVLFTEVRRVLKPNGRISGYTGHGANLNEVVMQCG